jgi:hypothetical protein
MSTGGPLIVHRWGQKPVRKYFFIHKVSTTGDTYITWDEWD